MNVNIGHGNQRITEAVAKQMANFSYVYPGMSSDPRGLLGKKEGEKVNIEIPNGRKTIKVTKIK